MHIGTSNLLLTFPYNFFRSYLEYWCNSMNEDLQTMWVIYSEENLWHHTFMGDHKLCIADDIVISNIQVSICQSIVYRGRMLTWYKLLMDLFCVNVYLTVNWICKYYWKKNVSCQITLFHILFAEQCQQLQSTVSWLLGLPLSVAVRQEFRKLL